jgi:hypothetical protein
MDFLGPVKNVGENTIAINLLQMTGVGDKVKTSSSIANTLKYGAMYTVAKDGKNWFNTGHSDILKMNWENLVDDSFYESVLLYGWNKVGLISKVVEGVNSVSPFDSRINNSISDGVLMSVNDFVHDLVLKQPGIHEGAMKYVLHISELWKK